jgi:hypothetical protein
MVDYNSSSSLESALSGIDSVVSNLGQSALSSQSTLIDAAIKAGVSRFIPSEFGCDTTNPKTSQLPVYADKIATQNYLAEKSSEGKISYSLVFPGAFLDWGTKVGFIANVKGGTTMLYDGGNVPFSATTLSDVGKAVAGVLKHPGETQNRAVYVNSAVITQEQLLAAGKKANPGLEIKTQNRSSEKIEKQGYEVLNSGHGDIVAAMMGFVVRALVGPGYGGVFQKLDNNLLDVPIMSALQVDELVAQII